MKTYKAIIFDFDMTLADSANVIITLLNMTSQHFGYPQMSPEDTLPVVGNTHEIMLSHVTGETDPGKLHTMREHYRQLCRDEMPARTEFFPDSAECLAAIHAKGIKIGLLSLKLRDVLMASLIKYDLAKYFSVVTGCEDVPAPKPDPSGLFITMDALGVRPEETLYIGDSLVDQGAAHSAGTDFAAMLRGGTKKEQFDPSIVKHFYYSADNLRQDIVRM